MLLYNKCFLYVFMLISILSILTFYHIFSFLVRHCFYHMCIISTWWREMSMTGIKTLHYTLDWTIFVCKHINWAWLMWSSCSISVQSLNTVLSTVQKHYMTASFGSPDYIMFVESSYASLRRSVILVNKLIE